MENNFMKVTAAILTQFLLILKMYGHILDEPSKLALMKHFLDW